MHNTTNRPASSIRPHPGLPASERPRVLIVDDETGVRNLLYDVLSLTYECDRAANGSEAIQLVAQKEYDVVLCDIMMPDVSGIEVLKFVREHANTTVVIMVTAVQDTRRAIEAIRLGAFDYMLKPFDIEEVELVVIRGIEFKRMTEENDYYQSRLEALVVERTAKLQEDNERLEADLLGLSLAHRATLATLSAILESRDASACGHPERVTAYAVRMAKELGIEGEALTGIEIGALMHDIGMVVVPDAAITREGPLDDAEWHLVRNHPLVGGELVRRIGFHREAIPVVEQHHERWDGSGYPRGLAGEQIHLNARIFAVADAVDAMVAGRPYRDPRSLSQACDELRRCSGTQFDPSVVDCFLSVALEEWSKISADGQVHGVPAARVTGPLVPTKSAFI